MTKIDKPANEPEVTMARWDKSRYVRDVHEALLDRSGGFEIDPVPEEIAVLRDRIAELEQVVMRSRDQAEKIAAMRDRIAELEQVAIDQAEKIASVWGSE